MWILPDSRYTTKFSLLKTSEYFTIRMLEYISAILYWYNSVTGSEEGKQILVLRNERNNLEGIRSLE